MQNHSFCKLSVPTFKQYEQFQGVTLYCIDVQVIGVTAWRLELRYSDLFDLNTILKAQFQKLPKFPGKTLSKLTTPEELEKRRIKLNSYLSAISERLDIVTCPVFCELFEIGKYAPKYVFEQPKIINCQQHTQTIKNCQYLKEQEALLVVSSQTEGYKQLMALMQNKENQISEALGQVELFSLKDNQMVLKWSQIFENQVHYNYNQRLNVCTTQRDAQQLDQKKEKQLSINWIQRLECTSTPPSTYQMHKMRVKWSILSQTKKKVIYSISQDGTFVVTLRDYLKHKDCELTALLVCDYREVAFIGNSKGSVFILDLSKESVQYLKRVDCQVSSKIVDIAINNQQGFLFAACESGQLQVLDIGSIGRESNSKPKVCIATNYQTKKISYCQQRHHLYIGDTLGNVTVISEQTGCPIYSVRAHELDVIITLVYYLEETNKVVTYGKDQMFKMWEFPTWINLNEIKHQEYQEIKQEQLIKQQSKQKQSKVNQAQSEDHEQCI
ncbi:unnamed protein product (macronuclear) [Paramecium tetraurelia]|uniref:PX domain-containing protein n=1 Tax=Paramecium tetraurelia TaxID=5888 RepID=A0EDP6_PARTE|nr:uncharacterized protein GSPATT00025757001 [Paramecium tetraurelia]CAK93413.1 unnamed protein product [Paramecium tetraurelia]|eukprot:XP_001460810.1 hypothetical protein (macronuclear) [Paramecium tetraurelia strain d4-2]